MTDTAKPKEAQPRTRGFTDLVFGLQCKFTILTVAVTMAVALVACVYLMRSSTRFLRQTYTRQAVHFAQLVADGLAPSMENGDLKSSATYASSLIEKNPYLYVGIFDVEGQLLTEAQWPDVAVPTFTLPMVATSAAAPVGDPAPYPAGKKHPPFAVVAYPIRALANEDNRPLANGGRLLGYVQIVSSIRDWQDWTATTTDLITGVGVILVLMSIPLSYFSVRRMVVPINHLCNSLAAFSSGNLNVRCAIDRRDEVGQLGDAFNEMASEHQRVHERLLSLNTDLEHRVARRTRQLRRLASRDDLTGLYNRRYFDATLERRFAEMRRYGSVLSCVMIDVDDFKRINDHFGHKAGDETLQTVGQVVRSQLRGADVGARYGGDEFALLLPHTTTAQACVLAERIAKALAKMQSHLPAEKQVTLTMGIADSSGLPLTSPAQLPHAADQALYTGKRAGKNCAEVASESTPLLHV